MDSGDLNSSNKQRSTRRWMDYLGVGLSVACLIHCLLLPLAIMFTPLLAGWLLQDEIFHVYLLAFILPVALIAFGASWLRHHSQVILACGMLGLTLISVAALQAAWFDHSMFSASMEKVLTSSGGFMLIAGHLLNLRLR